mmetsp:Transcript_132101/g.240362  ORF Transcript_132101/g.240362 Transcript_132101/m.240362 type:complete len:947 (+) Transcript_132101:197-3037(+)
MVDASLRSTVLGEPSMYGTSHGGLGGGRPPLVRGATQYMEEAGLATPYPVNARRPLVGSGVSTEGIRKPPVIVRGTTEYLNPVDKSAYVRGTTRFFHKEAGGLASTFDAEMDECLEGLMQLRETRDLVVMTMNLQYFASWPRDADAAWRELHTVTSVPPPDVICIQEGLHGGPDVLFEVGYRRVLSSATCSQPLREMLYNDIGILKGVDEKAFDKLLVNELYIRDQAEPKGTAGGSEWEAIDCGVERTSASIPLDHRPGYEGSEAHSTQWDLAQRSVVWVKLRHRTRRNGPFVYVLNTQLTSGVLEDQFFLKPALSSERRRQVQQCLEVFKSRSADGDLGILVGDFGAAPEDAPDGPRKEYFSSTVSTSAIMREEALQMGLPLDEVEQRFKAYHCSPFEALVENDWRLAYSQAQVGPTSNLGDLVDHMATSRAVPVSVKVFPTTNQKKGDHPAITQVPLSDHNFVKATFSVRYPMQDAEEKAAGSPTSPTQHYWIGDGSSAASPPPEHREIGEAAAVIGEAVDGEDSYAARCAKLERDREELSQKYRAQQEAIEELQYSINSEMRELRDKCLEDVQTISNMTKAMQVAQDAVTVEMERYRGTNAMLQAELEAEEHQRHALELEHRAEEEKARRQIEAAEKQLESMEVARRSLGMHLSSIGKIKAGFSEDIKEERRWRRELVEQGERQLREWREKNVKECDHLQQELDTHKASHLKWKSDASAIEKQLHAEWNEWISEESEANAALQRAQLAHESAKGEAEAKYDACQRLHEELRMELQEIDRESQQFERDHKPVSDMEHQHHEDRQAQLREEKKELQADIDVTLMEYHRAVADKTKLKELITKTRAERPELKDAKSIDIKKGQAEAAKLQQELQTTEEHIRHAMFKNEQLVRELERAEHQGLAGLFSCFRTKASAKGRGATQPPLPPPPTDPPSDPDGGKASSDWI